MMHFCIDCDYYLEEKYDASGSRRYAQLCKAVPPNIDLVCGLRSYVPCSVVRKESKCEHFKPKQKRKNLFSFLRKKD